MVPPQELAALDDVNESDKSEARIANWAKQIEAEMA